MSLVINVDSDGVVYDFVGAIQKLTRRELDTSSWDLGIPREEIADLFEEATLMGAFLIGDPIPGAIEGLATLMDAGHRVRIVTDKSVGSRYLNYVARINTLEWYWSQGLDVEIAFTTRKWGKTYVPADVIVDDKPDLSWAQMGRVNVLFNQPWNKQVPTNFISYRAYGWGGIAKVMEEVEAAA